MSHIFIASSSMDAATYSSVVAYLRQWGHKVTVYEADKVAVGSRSLTLTQSNHKGQVIYDGEIISADTVDAAWYRRPSLFGPESGEIARQTSIDNERRSLQEGLWVRLPDSCWLNAPHTIKQAENKLFQLSLASEIGFTIPETVVTNQWQDIKKLTSPQIVLKMPFGMLRGERLEKVLYATVLNNDVSLPTDTMPFPGIWQAYIPKWREWRVTVVGEQVFTAAIYTTSDAKDDWRKHQDGDKVTFQKGTLPKKLQNMCHKMLQRLNLRFGAFDLVETPNGEFVFLEVNPNGQYGWLEDDLKLPVSQAIAHELVGIAKAS